VRWNAAVAALAPLAAPFGLIAVIVAGVDVDASVLVVWRLALAAVVFALVLAVTSEGATRDAPPWGRDDVARA
jgi:hypothetical protein